MGENSSRFLTGLCPRCNIATKLNRRAVVRETNALEPSFRRKPLVIMLELGGKLLRIKEKGTHKWYDVDYATIYRMAVHIRAAEIKQEKKRARKVDIHS